MESQRTVYITGHRHPDTDSIVSAIAYALLLQRKGMDAVPCRLGKINAEKMSNRLLAICGVCIVLMFAICLCIHT